MLTELSIRRPKLILGAVLTISLLSALGFFRLQVDTDPENMLPVDDEVRVRNAVLREEFGAAPTVVIGVFGDVLNVDGLNGLASIHSELVARPDVIAESTMSVASIFDGTISEPGQVAQIVDAVAANPVLDGNVIFDDGSGAALFVALVSKNAATDVADFATETIAANAALADTRVSIAGQPLAEDAFGQQMFVQMAIFAPLAGLIVFGVLMLFFRRLQLALVAMLLSMATVVITMGVLVGSGNTLHIMSSMIPIFLMPIAIVDSVHVLSEFFDRYSGEDRSATLTEVFAELQRPIAFTSLTTGVGFAALMLVPIPPVRVFGFFVALGVGLAWLLTMSFLPAYLCWVSEDRLTRVAAAKAHQSHWLQPFGRRVIRAKRPILVAALLLVVVAVPLLSTISINDNPVRWFRGDHEIRVASDELGAVLPGASTANLLGSEHESGALDNPEVRGAVGDLASHLRSLPDVGAVQTYADVPSPMLRSTSMANIRIQLRSGDNTAMQRVVDSVDSYLSVQPIDDLQLSWAGDAYLNLTWQQKMVRGMLVGFTTTLGVIFLLLIALFRSLRWAVLAIAPVLWTVLVVYGTVALSGRDFDMPVAVLSTMILGIGVDFAIHFVERYRSLLAEFGSADEAIAEFYREPARALTRNALVIAVGFSPLLLSSLVPYVVVGALLASIIGLSWLVTLVVLPPLALRFAGSPVAISDVESTPGVAPSQIVSAEFSAAWEAQNQRHWIAEHRHLENSSG